MERPRMPHLAHRHKCGFRVKIALIQFIRTTVCSVVSPIFPKIDAHLANLIVLICCYSVCFFTLSANQ